VRNLWLAQLYHTTFLANQRSKFSQVLLTAICALVWLLTSFSHRFHCFQSRFLAKRVFALLICCNVLYLCCCKCVVKNLFFVFECLWLLCFCVCVVFCMFWLNGILMVCYCIVRQDVFTWKCLLSCFQNYAVKNLFGFYYLCYLTFHEFCRTTESLVFACFAFVSSQSSCGFFLNSCMFCICVVTNVDCVLFNCLHNLHFCCYKRILGSV